jgi:hypothetical protein
MEKVFSGAIVHIGETKTGVTKKGDTWKSQEFVVMDESGKYPENAVFSVTGAGVDNLKNFRVGMPVSVKYNLSAREYNGRWYNDLRAWGVFKEATEKVKNPLKGEVANQFNESQDNLDLPF